MEKFKRESESHSVVSDSFQLHGLYSPWNSPGQNTGVDSLFLLQGLFPTQGLNPGLLYCKQILYQLSYQGNPRILKWVAISFSRGSFQPRNRAQVSCIASRFFTVSASRRSYLRTILDRLPRNNDNRVNSAQMHKRDASVSGCFESHWVIGLLPSS